MFEILPSLEYSHYKPQEPIKLMTESFDISNFQYPKLKRKIINSPGKYKHNNTIVPIMVVNIQNSGWKYLKLRQTLQTDTTQYINKISEKPKINNVKQSQLCPVKTRSISLITISDLLDNSRKPSLDIDCSLAKSKQFKLEMKQFHQKQLQLIRNKFQNIKKRRNDTERQNESTLNRYQNVPELRTYKLTPEPRRKV